MGSNMVERSKTSVPKGAAVIGSNVIAIQTALTLARMVIEVKLITSSTSLGRDSAASEALGDSALYRRYLWPLLLQAAGHPLITLYCGIDVEGIKGKKGDFKIQVLQHPRYIDPEICTGCGRCEAECSTKVISLLDDQKVTHGAIHAPLLGTKPVPSAYVIDKNGLAPCRVACPLGINVQGFISLLSKGKTNKALALINESAPLAGILGRVCPHHCEDDCNRAKLDSAVSIRALHRYAADNALSSIKYTRKFPAKSRQGKIAIVGSGPAGLTAAWELSRRGYSPTVFESHSVIGGMLATGIPRFRLPKEVREREIEAIRNLGVDIRTGITVGRDITYTYLKERGYQAIFLAIGAQRNSRLNIPGEEMDGVVDCMALLLALNLKFDTFVGSNVAVIGGGNAAIDTARSALRSGAKEVTIFYRRTRAEMPANDEEIDEAIKEGVRIEFNVVPVEILGEKGRVTAIHCQRTVPAGKDKSDGPKMISGTDFLMEADHVVVAIGQSPDASQLHFKGLALDESNGAIYVNPLTLETSVPGVFAGGDCITGPNNVVEAMAAGLRAAESIDRYIQGQDLETERSFEPPPTAEVDFKTIEVAPYERAKIPVIRSQKRIDTYEETTLGISEAAAWRETQRCLNCALCSQCTECTTACELNAVRHDEFARRFEIEADTILRFPDDVADEETDTGISHPEMVSTGISTVFFDSRAELNDELSRAMVIALETAVGMKRDKAHPLPVQQAEAPDATSETSPQVLQPSGKKRLGVFLCNCGGSISSIIDFKALSRRLADLPGVTFVHEIAQSCTEAGARQIAEQVAEWQLDRILLAACRCCNLEQVCYSCTDRRQMCQKYLYKHLNKNTVVEFCNIREQCGWTHQDDPKNATNKAVQIISAGIACAQASSPDEAVDAPILPCIFVIGGGLANTAAAKSMASRGYRVTLISRKGLAEKQPKTEAAVPPAFEKFQEADLVVKPSPDSLELRGSPGNYEVVLKYGSQSERIETGAVLADLDELVKEKVNVKSNGLFRRILSRQKNTDCSVGAGSELLREITIGETAGIFTLPPDYDDSPGAQVRLGLATAARISVYLEQKNISPRASAVNIDVERCRGCSDCAALCPYIEMRDNGGRLVCADVNKNLCLGCGACITVCPTGAITQPHLSDQQIVATLRNMLQTGRLPSEV